MEIRPFRLEDEAACLAISPELKAPPDFFVLEHEGAILGFGGYEVNGPNSAEVRLMVHESWRRQGLGRYLLFYLLKKLGDLGPIEIVKVWVLSPDEEFYKKQGFSREYWCKGRSIYSKRLTVCT